MVPVGVTSNSLGLAPSSEINMLPSGSLYAEAAPPPSQADIEKLLEAAPRYGVETKVPKAELPQ
jgi:hypothetical protein